VPTVRSICSSAAQEIGALGQGETLGADDALVCLTRLQYQLDAWQAEALTLAVNTQLTFTIPGSSNTFAIGPTGDVVAQRPVSIEAMTYVVPGSSPEVETIMAPMSDDQYDALSIKSLPSSLPTQYYYNTSFTSLNGSMFVWPMPTQDVKTYVYVKQGAGVPVTLDDTIQGPAGYLEAFVYQLALRLMTPFSKRPEDVPLLVGPQGLANQALARIKRVNLTPGLLGVDAALVPSAGGAYNILNDTSTGYYGGR
jgi:hypothetical protein